MKFLMLALVPVFPILLSSCSQQENGCTITNIEKVAYDTKYYDGYVCGQFEFLIPTSDRTYTPRQYFTELGNIKIVYDVPSGGKAWVRLGESDDSALFNENRNTNLIGHRSLIELHVCSKDDIQYIAKKD